MKQQHSDRLKPRKSWFAALRDAWYHPPMYGFYHNLDPRTGKALAVAHPMGQALYGQAERNAGRAAGRRLAS